MAINGTHETFAPKKGSRYPMRHGLANKYDTHLAFQAPVMSDDNPKRPPFEKFLGL